jgi:PleD family two-component response regulator
MVRIADRALYSAKQHGRDRVEVPVERAGETV